MSEADKVVSNLVNSNGEHVGFIFWCPGCECAHRFTSPPWSFNGDFVKPTVRASILVRYEGEENGKQVSRRCHLFVTDGRINFLSDSTHPLRGKAVDMMPFPGGGDG